MSKFSKVFDDVPVDIQNRSGFDMSHYNVGSGTTGTLIPVLCQEVLPNDTWSVGCMSKVDLSPMAAEFYGRIDMRYEAFFVPSRILWGGWQNFLTMPENNPYGDSVTFRPTNVPCVIASNSSPDLLKTVLGPSTLADFLGYKSPVASSNAVFSLNMLPFLAYHKIYDDWYRNANVQKPLFTRIRSTMGVDTDALLNMPWNMDGEKITVEALLDSIKFANGDNLFTLHQRCWGSDYFTTAALYPQSNGDLLGATAEVDSKTNEISIASLRTANVLQRWLERNNIAGPRYADQLMATWGVMPSDAFIDRPIYIGSFSHGVFTSPVFNQTGSTDFNSNSNPWSGELGSSAGKTDGFGRDSLIDNFHTTEHGYIMVLASIVPHSFYSSGVDRMFNRTTVGQFANPLLQGLGEQAIDLSELKSDVPFGEKTFGYTPQYSDYKYHNDEIHGRVRTNSDLQVFALQRNFDSEIPSLDSDFLEIPIDFLDQVQTVATSKSGYSYIYNLYFDSKVIRSLSEYVIPTLGDLKDTHKESIPFRGRQIKG